MNTKIEELTIDELRNELKRLKENLTDIEEMHAFTFGKTTAHIGAEQAQNMQLEFEEECRVYSEQIAEVERLLRERNA